MMGRAGENTFPDGRSTSTSPQRLTCRSGLSNGPLFTWRRRRLGSRRRQILPAVTCELCRKFGMKRIAIVGGGPSGLFTGFLLDQKSAEPLQISLFEADGRLGGKVTNKHFKSVPLLYEA